MTRRDVRRDRQRRSISWAGIAAWTHAGSCRRNVRMDLIMAYAALRRHSLDSTDSAAARKLGAGHFSVHSISRTCGRNCGSRSRATSATLASGSDHLLLTITLSDMVSSAKNPQARFFHRWALRGGLTDTALRTAVQEIEQGLIDGDLGGGVLKKRVGVPGRGKSGSARVILATNGATDGSSCSVS